MLIPLVSFGQGLKGDLICSALKGFSSNIEAENALKKVLSTVGVKKNFVLTECSNVDNAAAAQI